MLEIIFAADLATTHSARAVSNRIVRPIGPQNADISASTPRARMI